MTDCKDTRKLKWWIARIVFLRRWTGCGGEGFAKDVNGNLEVCHRHGCH